LLLGLVGIETALFAAADAPMRPQAFEDHFSGRRSCGRVFAVLDAEAANVFHQALNFRELLVAIGSGGQLRQFQFAADFKPLNAC
jgi:hypothetical protein